MIKVLSLALYGSLAASNRIRLGQYKSKLLEYGIDLQIQSLLDNEYLTKTFKKEKASTTLLLSLFSKRLKALNSQKQFDIGLLHCELFPLFPHLIEKKLFSIPYIYDFDDAFFLKYRTGRMKYLEPFLGNKFDMTIQQASVVTAGSNFLHEYAKKYNTQSYLLPSVVDTTYYQPKTKHESSIFTVGWIGSPSTALYLVDIIKPLSLLGLEKKVRLVVIGGKAPKIDNIEVIEIPWKESEEVNLINSFDIGIMPLPDTDWARGKCAFKLIQYMACALPVVASRVGANIDVVTNECGFLVDNDKDWLDALRTLQANPKLRQQMGEAGRLRIEQHYSLTCNTPLFTRLIQQTANKNLCVI